MLRDGENHYREFDSVEIVASTHGHSDVSMHIPENSPGCRVFNRYAVNIPATIFRQHL